MSEMPFIFSNERRWRLGRHLVFWLAWLLFDIVLYSASPSPILQHLSVSGRLAVTWPESVVYLIPQLFLAYTLMYWVIPVGVIRRQYGLAVMMTGILFILTACLSALLSMTVIDYLRRTFTLVSYKEAARYLHPVWYLKVGPALLAGLRGAVTTGGLAAAIKLMKYFYERQQAALVLQQEKIGVELQALKAQLHPHLLFNTLNNIYSHTQESSPGASRMIMGLSALLRYMLYECDRPLVPLASELQMIRDYISIESARYGDDLDLSVFLPLECRELRIAPLLLLPFVENAFKHGAAAIIGRPWISLQAEIVGEVLTLKVINGKDDRLVLPGVGIGTPNVRKRLDMLYAGRYQLDIIDEGEIYVVNLKLNLSAG